MICTFLGHRNCFDLDIKALQDKIEELIKKDVGTFYVGHQGDFDRMVFRCLLTLRKSYPHISFAVVLAYFPTEKPTNDLYKDYTLYPYGLEATPPKFAIEKRNRWMIDQADYCLCYITHPRGGAYKFAKQAKRKGLTVINLGDIDI